MTHKNSSFFITQSANQVSNPIITFRLCNTHVLKLCVYVLKIDRFSQLCETYLFVCLYVYLCIMIFVCVTNFNLYGSLCTQMLCVFYIYVFFAFSFFVFYIFFYAFLCVFNFYECFLCVLMLLCV